MKGTANKDSPSITEPRTKVKMFPQRLIMGATASEPTIETPDASMVSMPSSVSEAPILAA